MAEGSGQNGEVFFTLLQRFIADPSGANIVEMIVNNVIRVTGDQVAGLTFMQRDMIAPNNSDDSLDTMIFNYVKLLHDDPVGKCILNVIVNNITIRREFVSGNEFISTIIHDLSTEPAVRMSGINRALIRHRYSLDLTGGGLGRLLGSIIGNILVGRPADESQNGSDNTVERILINLSFSGVETFLTAAIQNFVSQNRQCRSNLDDFATDFCTGLIIKSIRVLCENSCINALPTNATNRPNSRQYSVPPDDDDDDDDTDRDHVQALHELQSSFESLFAVGTQLYELWTSK